MGTDSRKDGDKDRRTPVLNRRSAGPRPRQIAVRDAARTVVIEARQHLPAFLRWIMQRILTKLAERAPQIV